MKYYKIIQNSTFIGIITSNNFIQYQEANHMFIGANAETGQLVNCNDKLYRSWWMKPFSNNDILFEEADILEISYEEYLNFYNAIEKQEEIVIDDEDIPNPEYGIDFIRSSKLNEMSYACRTAIEAGFDLEIRGETHHFSLTTQDQLNLMSLNIMAQTQDLIPYHADGEPCTYYSAEEIKQIVNAANEHKSYHTTYHNALKQYINALETIEEISAITYGVEIPDEYQSDVLRVLGG